MTWHMLLIRAFVVRVCWKCRIKLTGISWHVVCNTDIHILDKILLKYNNYMYCMPTATLVVPNTAHRHVIRKK